MSYPTYTSPYGTYQPTTPAYSSYQSPHYPSQYPLTSNTATSFPLYHHLTQPKSSPPPPDLPPSPPDLTSSISTEIASEVLQKLLSALLKDAGFDGAQPIALQRLQAELVAFIERLYERTHEYANLANRAGPIVTDLMLACNDMKLEPKSLYRAGKKKKRGSTRHSKATTLLPPPPRSPSPVLLPSDDEDTQPAVPMTLRTLPSYIPTLPPRHTYLRTPPSPPKKAALPSLEKKLKTASLVQQSLKNLLLATEDSEGQEDAELLGHIVNWETGLYPRKRWRVDS